MTTENKAPTDESLYITSIPAKTDAGTYYVWYKVNSDDNYTESTASAPVTVAIANMAGPHIGDPAILIPALF